MTAPDTGIDVTQLLLAWNTGETDARDQLMMVVYEELRRIAGGQLAGEKQGHTLQTTALVNEAYLRLVDQTRVHWRNRAHFFGIAAQLMRRILVDHARRRYAAKRGGGVTLLEFEDSITPRSKRGVDLVVLDDILTRLESFDADAARLVELRYFGGLTIEETAEVLGSSPATVKREWATARAWMHRELTRGPKT
ncbi:MAG: sigma-70 family RNA polymerase sigma factor [Acidobacteria bacterium]|nr:sigma-70 family RNA polymerase sigma factor [Acidobacteriota bacterium]